MRRTSIILAVTLAGVVLAACGKPESSYTLGDPRQSLGSAPPATPRIVTPPSSGTSNGTGMAIPPSDRG